MTKKQIKATNLALEGLEMYKVSFPLNNRDYKRLTKLISEMKERAFRAGYGYFSTKFPYRLIQGPKKLGWT